MGLLDQFGSMSDDQQQGLLAAAAQMLQQSGPSTRPVGLGQILGGGMMAYQDGSTAARKRKLEEDAAKQSGLMHGLQIQGLQGDLADKERGRAQALDAQKFYTNFNQNRTDATAPARSVLGSSLAPTMDNAALLDQAPKAPAASGGSQGAPAIFQQRLAQAQAMRDTGNPLLIQRADELEKSALAFQPKVKSWEKVTVGGRVLLKPYFEDGTAGDPVTADVAEKLAFQNTGKETLGLNPFTGARVASFTNTQSPDSAASMASAAAGRAQAERHFQAEQVAPQYMDTVDGIMALPKRLTPGTAPTGQLVTGPNGQPLEKKQNTPQYVVQAITSNAKSLSSIDAALASLGTADGKNAVGMKGYLPNAMLNRMYPEGTETRANISDVGSLILHDRSGAAVTAAESPRLMPFIPLATDDAATAKKKLTRFKQIFEAETNNLTFAFPQAKKLAEFAASSAPSKGAPAAPVNSDGWTLHTDASGNKAYVSPDGKQFKEAP